MTQPARQIAWTLPERSDPIRFLIRDRDNKFTGSFDGVFRSDGIRLIVPWTSLRPTRRACRSSQRPNREELVSSIVIASVDSTSTASLRERGVRTLQGQQID